MFKEGTAYCTLPDECSKDPADLLNILDVHLSNTDDVGPHDMLPAGNSSTETKVQTIAASDNNPEMAPEPQCLARLAAKTIGSTLHIVNPPDDSDNSKSEEKTYASMPSTLTIRTQDPNELWMPLLLYSEAIQQPDLWKGPIDQEIKRMQE